MIKNFFRNLRGTSKKEGRLTLKDLEYGFSDLEGRKYFRFTSQGALPLERYGELQDTIMWMSSGLTANELSGLVDLLETELENLVQQKKGSLVKVGAIVQEIKRRMGAVLHTELLYRFVAIMYVREDEDPMTVDKTIIADKVEAFKRLTKEGQEYDFFQIPELRTSTEILNLSQEEWEEYWRDSVREQDRLKKILQYLKSV